jgi:hypothetical protein
MLSLTRSKQSVRASVQTNAQIVYWHRELPAAEAEQMG